jgi:WD40-like Beta Propeller Repeat
MTRQASPDLLDLAEAVASGALRADDAERQVREALGPDHDAASDKAVRELRGLIVAASAVRFHVRATRDALGVDNPDVSYANASIATIVPGPVTAGSVRRSVTRSGGRPPRRTWLLVAATLLIGTGIIGASLVGGRLAVPTPEPTIPSGVVDASASPDTSPDVSVAPSPAPGMFAYIVGDQTTGGGWRRLWVANLDGTGAHELVSDMGGDQQAPVWSPDGTHLLFSWAPATIGEDGYPIGAFRFYLADVSGGEPQLVDTGCVAPCTGDGDLAYLGDAAFSRDGMRLVFVRSPFPGASVLATIDLPSGRVVELTSTMLEGDLNRHPRFSPDGSQIVFGRDLPIDPNEPKINGDQWPGQLQGLFAIDADGRNLRQIVPSGMPMDWPSYGSADWSPDGAHLVFEVGFASNPVPNAIKGNGYTITPSVDIYTIRPDGTDVRRLTSDGGSLDPGWTTDGRILFARWAPDQPLPRWIMDADGGNQRQLSFPQQLLGASPNQAAIMALTAP